jgi:hypothetical protein
MFDWFKNIGRGEYPAQADVPLASDIEKIGADMGKVLQFPELKTPPMPEVAQPKEESGRVFYRLGLTENNRVALSMYYGEVSMNCEGVQNLIDQLEFYKSMLKEESTDDNS